MKKLLTIIFSMSLIACGGGGGDTPPTPPPTVNKAPSKPGLVEPSNGLLCIDNTQTFQWNSATDPDGDSVTYQLQIARDTNFTDIAQNLTVSGTSQSVTLERGVAYYWRVKAIDSKNLSGDYSSTFNLYTEGDGESNHLPFAPVLTAPTLHAVIQTATTDLQWTANDTDSDPLTYDVFLDTVNPPATKVSTSQTGTVYTATLTAAQTYYWKVVVKDDKGGETIGQIWSFKTD